MDYLPFDIKETIATHLGGSDLAAIAQVDPDYKTFFRAHVVPTFISEFIKISKIYRYLNRIFDMKICDSTTSEHVIMSRILGREVEENELFRNGTDYAVWMTMSTNIGLNPRMTDLVDIFKFHANDFNNIVDEGLEYDFDDVWGEHEDVML